MKYTLDFEKKVIILLEKCNLGELLETLDEDKKSWDLDFSTIVLSNKDSNIDLNKNMKNFMEGNRTPYDGWNNPYRKNPLITPPYKVTFNNNKIEYPVKPSYFVTLCSEQK